MPARQMITTEPDFWAHMPVLYLITYSMCWVFSSGSAWRTMHSREQTLGSSMKIMFSIPLSHLFLWPLPACFFFPFVLVGWTILSGTQGSLLVVLRETYTVPKIELVISVQGKNLTANSQAPAYILNLKVNFSSLTILVIFLQIFLILNLLLRESLKREISTSPAVLCVFEPGCLQNKVQILSLIGILGPGQSGFSPTFTVLHATTLHFFLPS